ncbi:MAG: signal peptidase I [Anaerolineales bacterium]|nr:signal peptidase I [Anaerolineales bacterium]
MSEPTKPASDPFALQPDTPPVGDSRMPSTAEPVVTTSETTATHSNWAMIRELLETIVLSLIIFLLIRQVVQNYRIENHSMEPNFFEGQFVLVNKLAFKLGEPTRGDVVVFHNPENTNEDFIKRIIGVPGDVVEVRDQTVLINGQPVIEDFPHEAIPPGLYTPPMTVPENNLFVMGDNRPNSRDSRSFGPISQDLLVGKAWLRIWPLNKFGIVAHIDLPLGTAAQ